MRPSLTRPPRYKSPAARQRPVLHRPAPARLKTPTRTTRAPLPTLAERPDAAELASPASANPYVDFARQFTAEGGIAITYKDLDERFRYTLRRVALWVIATGAEAWFSVHLSPIPPTLGGLMITLIIMTIVAIINWLIVRKPVEVHRSIEIRPDCMIVEGEDVFWRDFMEGGYPKLVPKENGVSALCGIYGTRWVEYLSVRALDELDRSPAVLAAHLQAAMQQLWSPLGRESA